MALPSPQDAIAFVTFFFPGFLTFTVAHIISGGNIKNRSELELIVWSTIFSIVSFSLAGVALIPDEISKAVFSPQIIANIFLCSGLLGIVLGIVSISWLYMSNAIRIGAQRVAAILHITYRSHSEKCSSTILRQLYANYKKSEVIVHVDNNVSYRGFLGGYGGDPLEVVLMASEDKPIVECRGRDCNFMDEYFILFTEKEIKRISAIRTE